MDEDDAEAALTPAALASIVGGMLAGLSQSRWFGHHGLLPQALLIVGCFLILMGGAATLRIIYEYWKGRRR